MGLQVHRIGLKKERIIFRISKENIRHQMSPRSFHENFPFKGLKKKASGGDLNNSRRIIAPLCEKDRCAFMVNNRFVWQHGFPFSVAPGEGRGERGGGEGGGIL